MDKLIQIEHSQAWRRWQAQKAAGLGAEFIAATREGAEDWLREAILPGSVAALQLELFGVNFYRLVLHLNDPREEEELEPFEFEFEGNTGLLQLGVLEPLAAGDGHFYSIIGALLVLKLTDEEWQVIEALPALPGAPLRDDEPYDRMLLDIFQGYKPLALAEHRLDPVERLFLKGMQERNGQFNLDETLNAARLWRDFKAIGTEFSGSPAAWAAAVEYLIGLFDHFKVSLNQIAKAYSSSPSATVRRARELALALNTTQFDDRYSIHPDPIAHYREVFSDIGGRFSQEEMEKAQHEYNKVFDKVEVPPDDTDFYGPS